MTLKQRIDAGEVRVPPGTVYDSVLGLIRDMTHLELADQGLIDLVQLKIHLVDLVSKELDVALVHGVEWPTGSGVWYGLDEKTRGLSQGMMLNLSILGASMPWPQPFPTRDDRAGGFASAQDFQGFYLTALQVFTTLSGAAGAKKEAILSASAAQEAAQAFRA